MSQEHLRVPFGFFNVLRFRISREVLTFLVKKGQKRIHILKRRRSFYTEDYI